MLKPISILMVVFLFMTLTTPLSTTIDYPLDINLIREAYNYTVETYFSNITINALYGSIIESYSSRGYYITSQRLFQAGVLRNTIFYEIIPPPEASYYTIDWWPGAVLTSPSTIHVVEKTPYRIILRALLNITSLHKVSLIKEYVMYYDKPYFDIKYIFTNNENNVIKFDLSNEYRRPVSFFIEISSCFAGDYLDDLQIIGTRVTYIYRNYTTTTPVIAPGLIRFIGLASYYDDYDHPHAIIVLPIGETLNYTYAAYTYTSQVFDKGTSIVGLEMKSFEIEPNTNITFSFRVFMGILSEVFLSELGILGLRDALYRTVVYYIPRLPPRYSTPPYRLDLKITLPKPDLYLNATLFIYRIQDSGDLELVKEIDLSKREYRVTIQLDQPGFYVFKLEPSYGFTGDYMHIYEEVYVNGIPISNAIIPIFDNIVMEVSFKIIAINWVTILVVDENYVLSEFVKDSPLVIEFRDRAGNIRRFIIREPVTELYITPGLYEVVVKPFEIANTRLADVYFNNYYVIYRISTNESTFLILLKGGSRDTIVLRYINLRTIGISPVVLIVVIVSLVSVAALLSFILYRLVRGRRL